jgi:MarR family transcriptional regulator, organic hydroperoxide resistance regulator
MPTKRRAKARANDRAVNVLRQFRLIFGSIRQHFRKVEEVCGVSGSQLWILKEASRTPGVGVTEVAARLSIHQTTCTQLVEKLVRRRLLKRTRVTGGDRRRVGLFVTKMGQRRLDCAPGPVQGVLPEALSDLPAPVLRSLEVNLNRLIQELEISDPADAKRPLADL